MINTEEEKHPPENEDSIDGNTIGQRKGETLKMCILGRPSPESLPDRGCHEEDCKPFTLSGKSRSYDDEKSLIQLVRHDVGRAIMSHLLSYRG